MGWIKYQKGSFPEKLGEYLVIKLFAGSSNLSLFNPVFPKKEISRMIYKQVMKLEENLADRCIYRKYNAWVDKYEQEQNPEEILYWYKLDEMPDD